MRCHNKAMVKLVSILTGASIATLIYSAQNRNTITHREDRYAVQEFHHSHPDDHDHGLDLSILAKDQHVEHLAEEAGPRNKPKLLKPFVTIKPNNPELTFITNQSFTFSSCPSSLQMKLQSSPWSSRYYHPAVRLIMTRTNIPRDEYERLKPYSMPFGFHYRDELTFDELINVLQLFPGEESIFSFNSEVPRPPCVSCAVVGNGGILNGSGMGQEIDNHDMVFRVNHCIRRGFEKDVGTRTTHYVFMDRSLVHTKEQDIPKDKGMTWVFLPCRKNDYSYISEVARRSNVKQKLKADAKDIRIIHPDFVRYIHKVWMQTKSFRPSTGAMMLMTALHSGCDRLSVYGMGFTKAYTEHYYDTIHTVYKNVKGSHDFAREIEIMKQLDKAGVLNWYKRDVPEFLS